MSGACVLKCVPEGKYGVSNMACVNACMHGNGTRTDPDGGRVYFGNCAGSAERCVQGLFLVFGAAWVNASQEAGA